MIWNLLEQPPHACPFQATTARTEPLAEACAVLGARLAGWVLLVKAEPSSGHHPSATALTSGRRQDPGSGFQHL